MDSALGTFHLDKQPENLCTRKNSNVRGHVAIITETKSTYVMIEFTLQFDDVEDIPGLTSPGSSKVTYVVKRMVRETAWNEAKATVQWQV